MTAKIQTPSSENSFDDLLKEKGCYESTTLQAIIEMLDEAIDDFKDAENVDKEQVGDQLQKILSKVQRRIESERQVGQTKS